MTCSDHLRFTEITLFSLSAYLASLIQSLSWENDRPQQTAKYLGMSVTRVFSHIRVYAHRPELRNNRVTY